MAMALLPGSLVAVISYTCILVSSLDLAQLF